MIKEYKTHYVDSLPKRENMKVNTIYVSEKTWMSSHLCACGCGEEVITPFIRGGWNYYIDDNDSITISPSIVCESCSTSYKIHKGYAIV